MKALTQKGIQKQLIKIINKLHIESITQEPRWSEDYVTESPDYFGHKILIGSVITITTSERVK